MSCPINPLSKYQSYAYQQILIVCDTTETAEELSKTNNYLAFMRSQDGNRVNSEQFPYAKYEPYNIALDQGRTGRYSILVSGMQDAEFVITKANWYNTVAAGAGGDGNEYSTYSIGGEMEIMEPQGIRFMNVLSVVADKLGSDPIGLVFMLKTVFVGHSAAGFSNDGFPDPITNIRPLLFTTSKITGKFSVSGGEYSMKFWGVAQGTSKNQHILRGTDRIKFNTAGVGDGCEANTLRGCLCKLQNRIGVIYDTYYNEVRDKVEGTTDEDGKRLYFTGRRVNYIIQPESPYDSPDYLVTDFKDSATNTAETSKGGMIDLSNEMSVEAAILAIAKRCPKVQEDLRTGDGQTTKKVRYVPKVSTTIETTDTEYNIVYKLRRVVESREDIIQVISNRTSDNKDDLSLRIQENLLTLDYMYTGKNTDIIDFDLEMALGLALFQNMATTDNIPEVDDNIDGTGPEAKTAEKTPINGQYTYDGTTRPRTPIFLSTVVTQESIKHSTNAKRAIDFQELMNRHAAIENISAKVKIHGNPGLLNTVNQPPSEIIGTEKSTDTESNTDPQNVGDCERSSQDVFPYWERIPSIVQINIRMPSTYYGGASNSNDFSEPFWYQGYYYCYAVEQFFDNGEFTQELHMVSIPKNSAEENTQSSITNTEQDAQTSQSNRNNKTAGAGSGTTSSSSGQAASSSSSAGNGRRILIEKDASYYTSKEYQEAHSGN